MPFLTQTLTQTLILTLTLALTPPIFLRIIIFVFLLLGPCVNQFSGLQDNTWNPLLIRRKGSLDSVVSELSVNDQVTSYSGHALWQRTHDEETSPVAAHTQEVFSSACPTEPGIYYFPTTPGWQQGFNMWTLGETLQIQTTTSSYYPNCLVTHQTRPHSFLGLQESMSSVLLPQSLHNNLSFNIPQIL